MKKFLLIFNFLFLFICTSWAFEDDLSFQISFLPKTQDNGCTFTLQNDFIFLSDSFFRFGPTVNAGWSCARDKTDGSNVIIYGYTFGGGLKTQFRLTQNLFLDADALCTLCYGTFPEILWTDFETGLTWYFSEKYFARFEAGILYWDNLFRFKGSGACGIRF